MPEIRLNFNLISGTVLCKTNRCINRNSLNICLGRFLQQALPITQWYNVIKLKHAIAGDYSLLEKSSYVGPPCSWYGWDVCSAKLLPIPGAWLVYIRVWEEF